MERKERKIYKQHFPNVEKKYRYFEEIDEIVLEEDVTDLVEKYNSERHTCLKETLKRFLGEDYAKMYGEQQIQFDDENIADEFEQFDKLEFYTSMNNFCNDIRKKYNLSSALSLDDIIKYCSDNAEKVKKDLNERGVINEKISSQ